MAYDADETLGRNRNRSWWQQRTRMERRGVVLLVISALIIIGLIIAIALVSHKAKKDANKHKDESVCSTKACVHTAANVLKNLDESADPCDDFYQFACGGFIKETEIPSDKAEVNVFSILRDLVQKQLKTLFEEPINANEPKSFVLIKKLYNSCMNTTAIENDNLSTLKELLRETGPWPILEGGNWNEAQFDWIKTMLKLRKQGVNFLSIISAGVVPDAKNSSIRIFTIDQPTLALPQVNFAKGFEDDLVKGYYSYMVDLAVFLGVERRFAENEVRSVINFATEIAKISITAEQRRDVAAMYNPTKINDLQRTYRSIQWLELINGIIGNSDKNVSYMDTVNIAVPQYISALEGLLNPNSRRGRRDQANYAFFLTLTSLVDLLPDHIRDRAQQFQAIMTGTSARQARWTECIEVTNALLKVAASALYARTHFEVSSKENVVQMVFDIRNAFGEIIKKLEWMDDETKKTAIDKAQSMSIHIGYPDELLDDKKLEEYYSKLSFSSDNYLKIVNQIQVFTLDKSMGEWRDPVNKSDWTDRLPSFDVNAGYAASENSIQFPAGILQGVFFNKDRPHYMNYGGISYVIGHEITHGFDDQGKMYDKNGNMENWWAEKTNKAYMDKAKCIVDQYGGYTVPELGINLNGENTQGENIADNGGIKEAYEAYGEWVKRHGPEPTLPGLNYTAKQLFWISAAHCWCSKERKASLEHDIHTDEHSPNRYRVLVPFGNTDYFAKDFNCHERSKMNPKHKCHVW